MTGGTISNFGLSMTNYVSDERIPEVKMIGSLAASESAIFCHVVMNPIALHLRKMMDPEDHGHDIINPL